MWFLQRRPACINFAFAPGSYSSRMRTIPSRGCAEDYALPSFASMKPSDFAVALRAAIDDATFDLNSFEDDLADPAAEFSWSSVMDRLEIINDPLDRLWRALLHLSEVMNSPELRAVEAEMQTEVLAIQHRSTQSHAIFHAMAKLRTSDESATFSPEQTRLLHRAIENAILSGIALVENDRDRFNTRQLRLSTLYSTYSNNLLDAQNDFSLVVHDKIELDGLSAHHLALFAQKAAADGLDGASAASGPWTLSLEGQIYSAIQKYCANRSLRETMYRARVSAASSAPHDNMAILQEILQLRQEQARLLGFRSFAELSMATKMAPSVAAVDEMLESLRHKSMVVSAGEVETLQAYATAHGQSEMLRPWDVEYWSECLRKDTFHVDAEEIKTYFPLNRVLDGLFALIVRLFGVRIEAADGDVETWHPDVRFFRMRDMDQSGEPVVASFFLDLFARPGQKQSGLWIEALASRSKVLGGEKYPFRIPVFSLMVNLPPPADDGHCLLSFENVDRLCIVFGYGLRTALTTADCTAVSRPIGVEWDCVDMPAEFLRLFRFDRGHVDTGECLPDSLLDNLLAAERFMGATNFLSSLHIAATDMALHHRYDPFSTTEESIFDLQKELAERFYVVERHADDRSLCQMDAIVTDGYGAGLYSYVWSEMLASDAYAAFKGTTTPEEWKACGRKFRDTILGLAGIFDANQVYEMFRGRKPCPDILLQMRGIE
ncbi:Aste57867_22264 [Aphanomyces stellatus]|uniref:oligopeptidase A n=1 Tax=Aphanomyces stellatus TaxID=120398 RepID=A0A485LJY2_9STRA|nr:hypothetical protein As57867_022194 [Aphanomyces stellatus]VFT98931.1 Aste57867_22264 [Aphanomyces stellatus]